MEAPESSPTIESFLTLVRRTLRARQMSLRTEEAYLLRIRQFILFHGKRHPQNLTPDDVRLYLTHLAVEGEVAASTQKRRPQRPRLPLPRRPRPTPAATPRPRTRQTTRTAPRRLHPRRSQTSPRPPRRHPPPHGLPPLRCRPAPHGMPAIEGQRHRPRHAPDHHPRRQRPEGPPHHAPPTSRTDAGRASIKSANPLHPGPRRPPGQRLPARCPRP